MNQKEIDKQRRCSHLLPPPGGEVVRALLTEIEKLQSQPEFVGTYCHVTDIEFRGTFIIPEVGQLYIRLDPHSVRQVQCIQIIPSVDIVMLDGNLRVCRVSMTASEDMVEKAEQMIIVTGTYYPGSDRQAEDRLHRGSDET